MKDKLQKWIREQGDVMQEISQGISWYGNKALANAKQTLHQLSQVELPKLTLFSPEPAVPISDSAKEARELARKLDQMIHSAYYKEGGYRYYGCLLMRYVQVVLPSETEVESVWAAGYNSCLHPMFRQLMKLESEMDALCASAHIPPAPLKNKLLLQKMRHFQKLSQQKKLDLPTDRNLENYRSALQQYARELDTLLLQPYRPADL